MGIIEISEFTEDTVIEDTDIIYFKESDGSDKKITGANLFQEIQADIIQTGLFENAVVNPDGAVAQRGTSFTAATTPANSDDSYLIDGQILLSDGNDIVDVSQSTDSPDGSETAVKYLVATANKKFGVLYPIANKNSMPLDNNTVSLSFAAKTTAAKLIENLRAVVLSWSSTADAITSDVVSAWNAEGANPTFAANWTAENTATDIAITTSYVTYKIEGISVDTASMANLAVFIWVDDTDAALNDELFIDQVKLNKGSLATPYNPRHESMELAICQRRLYVISGDAERIENGQASSGTAAVIPFRYPIEMPSVPAVTISAAAHYNVTKADTSGQAVTVFVAALINTQSCRFGITVAANLVAGNATHLVSISASARITISSEL